MEGRGMDRGRERDTNTKFPHVLHTLKILDSIFWGYLYLHSDLSLQVKWETHNVVGMLKKFQIFRLGVFSLRLTQLAQRREVLAPSPICHYFRTMQSGQSPVWHLGWGAVMIALALAQSQPLESMQLSGKKQMETRRDAKGVGDFPEAWWQSVLLAEACGVR